MSRSFVAEAQTEPRTMPLLETRLAMTEQLVLVIRLLVQEVPGGLNLGVHCSEHAQTLESTRGVPSPEVVATCLWLSRESSHAPSNGILSLWSSCSSRQFRSTASWSQCRATLSDHRLFHHQSTRHLHGCISFRPSCFYHGFFEVLKVMGVTGCVCCAGSTPAPTFLLTRTGHRVSFVVLAGLESGVCGSPTRTKSYRTDAHWLGRSAVFK